MTLLFPFTPASTSGSVTMRNRTREEWLGPAMICFGSSSAPSSVFRPRQRKAEAEALTGV